MELWEELGVEADIKNGSFWVVESGELLSKDEQRNVEGAERTKKRLDRGR
jgi:hypothetical protein